VRHPRDRWLVGVTLLLLLAAGVALRWLYIQRISLYFDEFITLWASRTILERGLPLFPSGNFYSHGILHTYLQAPFLWALGLREPLLRLPSLLIGSGTVVAIFIVAQRLFREGARGYSLSATPGSPEGYSLSATPGSPDKYSGVAVGLAAAAAVALDPEAVAWGGRVRMYALLQLLVLLAVYAFYRAAIAGDRPTGRWLAMGLLVAAMFTQAEAALLLPALGLALLVARGWRWCLRPSVVGPFVLAGAALVWVAYGGNLGEASHLEGIGRVRPYLALPGGDLLSGLKGFGPAFLDPWRLPFTLLALVGWIPLVRRPRRNSALLYLYLLLAVALGELFFLAGPTWQTPRYAFMLLPLLWLLADATLARWLRPAWLGVAGALALALFVGLTGHRAAFVQEPAYDRALRYVQAAWQPGDVVLTTNPAGCALYLERCDYYAMQFGYEEYVLESGGALVDRWVGAPLLNTVAELEEVLATSTRTWLIVDGWRFQSRFDQEFIRSVLDQMEPAFTEQGMAVFLGRGYRQRPAAAISRPLAAGFGRELALVGYELSAGELQPGGELEVSLLWQALDDPRPAYVVFLHLVGREGGRAAQRDELLLGGWYQPTVWPKEAAAESTSPIVDRHLLELPADLPPGRYRLEVGLYPPGEGPEGRAPVVLDYLTTAGLSFSPPDTPLDVNLGGKIRLLGYGATCDLGTMACDVRLHWQAMADLEVDYTVFVHLVGEDGRIAGQDDRMPEGGFYPTSAWEPGEIVVDEHHFGFEVSSPPGTHRLLTGLYQLETAQRLAVLGLDGQPLGDSVLLTTIAFEP
jgi:4-amino-4-deoxy-L-arabinose transferase-like glycosyltransferase